MNNTDYAIKYYKRKLDDKRYVLIPVDLVVGYSVGEVFYTDLKYQIVGSIESIENCDYLIDDIHNIIELCSMYNIEEQNFAVEYFLEDAKSSVVIVEKGAKELKKRKINLDLLNKIFERETYATYNEEPAVTLNYEALSKLLNIDDIKTLKVELFRLKDLLNSFIKNEKPSGITKLVVENGKIKEVFVNKQIENPKSEPKLENSEISFEGLEKYIKERVFGHDEEIKMIAKTIFMNYQATEEEGTEPILIMGPTGTGKTETVMAAASYLGIPFKRVGSANLVPEGIQGMSIESVLNSLLSSCENDLEKAQKGLIFFDELDKLDKEKTDLNIKKAVRQILLDFLESGQFTVGTIQKVVFQTKMLNKVFGGTFQDLFEKKNNVGFIKDDSPIDSKSLIKGNYFDRELVTRIPKIFRFDPLTREMKKQVILYSKISLLKRKIDRYKRQFNTTLEFTDDYIEAILDKLSPDEKSMREVNFYISKSLDYVECELLSNKGKMRKIVLTHDTVENPKKFDYK